MTPSIPTYIAVSTLDADHRSGFVLAHEKYEGTREIAFQQTLRTARLVGLIGEGVRIRSITAATLAEYRFQWTANRRHWTGFGGWDWEMLVRRYCRKPRAFHASVWSGDVLCGLCVGRVCRSRSHIMIPYMESNPNSDHPLRGVITPLVFDACRNYPLALGVERILLRDPLSGVQDWYTRFGFALAYHEGRSVYFASSVKHRGG